MNTFTKIVLALAIIGAINWGLIGFFNWNLVNAIFGGASQADHGIVSRIIYALVGLSGLSLIALWPRLRETTPAREAMRRAEARP
jgi:uncharacterized membrane protein YuzA (DUF378 family)